MKKKAIKTAGTYDEFKNLVACAQQKPVDRGSLLSFTEAKAVRNTAARSAGGEPVLPSSSLALAKEATEAPLPRNVHDFCREMRRVVAAERFSYIARIPPGRFRRIFAGELDSDILSDIILCFDGVLRAGGRADGYLGSPEDASAAILAILSSFPKVDRFDLTLGLLTKEDVAVLRNLFSLLEVSPGLADAVASLRELYKCTVP